MGIDLRVLAANFGPLALGVLGVVVAKALVTGLLLLFWGKERATALEAGILMSSPSETTLIVLGTAATAQLIQPATAQFWQIVTAIGLTITPLLAKVGQLGAGRVRQRGGDEAVAVEEPEGHRTVILGFGRVGRLIGEMLAEHERPYLAIDAEPAVVRAARAAGQPVLFGNIDSAAVIDRLNLAEASAVIVTMDEPVLALRIVRKLRALAPEVPIIVRARDPATRRNSIAPGPATPCPKRWKARCNCPKPCWSTWASRWAR
jgi:CPA2 family monovalent cation:H+ antiporter-2